MFKIAGHTMGTPEYTVCEATELMHRIGADGIEIVVQDDYCSGLPCDCDENTLSAVKQCAEKNGIQIICLTPYNSYFNSLDENVRQREIAAIKKVIGYCDYLGAKYIRTYGGNLAAGDTEKLTERRAKLVESMRELGDAAAEKGVTLVIENHFNTMAVSAKESASLIEEIDHPAVRILYDQANLTFTENECYEEAIPVQQKYVKYIHVKDLVFKEGVAFFPRMLRTLMSPSATCIRALLAKALCRGRRSCARLKSAVMTVGCRLSMSAVGIRMIFRMHLLG